MGEPRHKRKSRSKSPRSSSRRDKDKEHKSSKKSDHRRIDKNERKRKREKTEKVDEEKRVEISPPHKRDKRRKKEPEQETVEKVAVTFEPEVEREDEETGGGEALSLSVADTNKLRAKLGLAPLEDSETIVEESTSGDPNEKIITEDGNQFVHKKPENWSEKKQREKVKEKLLTQQGRRRMQEKLSRVKPLAEQDEDEDAQSWIDKLKKAEEERQKAAQRAKMLEEMDEEFGVSDLLEEEETKKKSKVSAAKSRRGVASDLAGITVEHSKEMLVEGGETVLVLKDKDVLDEDGETLVNPTLVDEEKWKKNAELRKKKGGYQPYDEENVDDFGNYKAKVLLGKYDEELDGEKRNSFQLDKSGSVDVEKERRLAELKAKLRAQNAQSLDASDTTRQLATEYYTHEEMQQFKKPKGKKRVLRSRKKTKALTADDLLLSSADAVMDPEAKGDLGSRSFHHSTSSKRHQATVRTEQADTSVDNSRAAIDDRKANDDAEHDESSSDDDERQFADLANIVIEDEAEEELAAVLDRARRLRQEGQADADGVMTETKVEKIARQIKSEVPDEEDTTEMDRDEEANDEQASGILTLNATTEYCRGIGDTAVAKAEGELFELAKIEMEAKKEKRKQKKQKKYRDIPDDEVQAMIRQQEESKGKWVDAAATSASSSNAVRKQKREDGASSSDDSDVSMDEKGVEEDSSSDDGNVLGDETQNRKGVMGAVMLAQQKGYLEKSDGKNITGVSLKHLESKRYRVEDKQFHDIDDKYTKKLERMGAGGGPMRPFEEKTGFSTDIQLAYCDQYGRALDPKDAFRQLSWKFHGKNPGKKKIEKREKKFTKADVMKAMSSEDTPLGTLNKQLKKQEQLQQPYIVLSGSSKTEAIGATVARPAKKR